MIRVLALFLLSASSLRADPIIVDAAAVIECHAKMATTQYENHCIGEAANACQMQHGPEFDGGTTLGISTCLLAEKEVWQGLLNATYLKKQTQFAQEDEQSHTTIIDRTDAFQEVQNAWEIYRDAQCRYAFARFQEGTISSNASAGCLMQMTAKRAIALNAESKR